MRDTTFHKNPARKFRTRHSSPFRTHSACTSPRRRGNSPGTRGSVSAGSHRSSRTLPLRKEDRMWLEEVEEVVVGTGKAEEAGEESEVS